MDLKLDVWKSLSVCSIAIQQLIAIARALDVSAKLLVLDEPTSSLDEQEVRELFKVIRKLPVAKCHLFSVREAKRSEEKLIVAGDGVIFGFFPASAEG